jgi:tRNA-2-methylthio-N6-dimethylallyladenosine synthase
MNFYIETVGCQMNVLDSELAAAELLSVGWTRADERKDANLILFNTCSVREHAEEKVYSALGRLKHWKTQKPGSIIAVMGCMAQREQTTIFKRAPHVDVVCGPGQIDQLASLIGAAAATGEQQIAVGVNRFENRANPHVVRDSFRLYDPKRLKETRPRVFQAMVRIMFGCNKFCSYCIVPSVRGPEQSRPPKDILNEIKRLADQDVVEVVLLGQTVNSYRYVEGEKTTRLSDLLVEIDKIPGIRRVRFVSSYPTDMTDELLQAVRDLPSSTPFLHVPAQHGANSMLKRMRRHYTVEEYKELVDRIYATIPGATITSDFIVGFCGETEEEFQQTVDLVRYAKFKNSFIFKYSERPGNEAARMMKDDIPEEVKKQRNNELLAVQNEISLEGSRSFIGKTVEILVEGPSKRETKSAAAEDALYEETAPVEATFDTTGVVAPIPEKTLTSVEETLAGSAPSAFGQDDVQMTGRTACDRIVVFDGTRDLAGGFHKIKITDAAPFTLVGEFVE